MPVQLLEFNGHGSVARQFKEVFVFGHSKFEPVVVETLHSKFASLADDLFERIQHSRAVIVMT